MPILAVQLMGLPGLGSGLAIGYRRWIQTQVELRTAPARSAARHASDLTYGVGVGLAGLLNRLSHQPMPIAYIGVFSTFGIGAAILLR